MKKTTKLVLTSVLAIALCVSLIAGATFALFTSDSSVNIAVTSGKVKVTAVVTDLYYASNAQAREYSWNKATQTTIDNETVYEGVFANEGVARYYVDSNDLKLNNITPGDAVKFTLDIENESNVAIKYRLYVRVVDLSKELFQHLEISAGDLTLSGGTLASYSQWMPLVGDGSIDDLEVVIEFPYTVGNEAKDMSCELEIGVEAVQGNGKVVTTSITADDIDDVDFSQEDTNFQFVGEFEDGIDLSDTEIADSSTLTFNVITAKQIVLPHRTTITGNNQIEFIADEEVKQSIVANGKLTLTDGILYATGAQYIIRAEEDMVNADVTISNMQIYADGGIQLDNLSKEGTTGDNTEKLRIVNSYVELGDDHNLHVSARNGTSTLEIVDSTVYCGNIYVGGHTLNEPYSIATFNVSGSYVSCTEKTLGSTIAIWGEAATYSKIIDSEIHTYSRGWHQSEDANDNAITYQSGHLIEASIERSNMHLYGARSIIVARSYFAGEDYTSTLDINDCFIWENSKELHAPIWNATSITNTIVVSGVYAYTGKDAISATVYDNPSIYGSLNLITQVGWALDINVVDQTITFKAGMQFSICEGAAEHNFVLGEGGKIVVEEGASIANIGIKAADGYTLVTTTKNGATVYEAK